MPSKLARTQHQQLPKPERGTGVLDGESEAKTEDEGALSMCEGGIIEVDPWRDYYRSLCSSCDAAEKNRRED
jgi:hypothetical protein